MISSQTNTESKSNYTSLEEQQEHLRGGKGNISNLPQKKQTINQAQHNGLPFLEANDFLPSINRWTSLGGLFLSGAVGVMFILASVIDYKVTVKAQAVVRPVGELRLVQSAMEGTIISVSAQENQLVKKGDTIAIIDDSQLRTNKNQRESSIKQGKLQLLQIDAQIRAMDSQIRAENDRIQRAIASAQAQLNSRKREYQDQKNTSQTQVQESQANLKQAQKEVQKLSQELISKQANLKAAQSRLAIASAKWERYQIIIQEGAISKNLLEEAQLAVEQQQIEVEVEKANIEVHKQLIEQQKQAIESARARWQRSQIGLNPNLSPIKIASENIAQEKASGEATLATLDKEREAFIQQRIEISKQLERDTHELQQIENNLGKTIITATEDGIISSLNLRNPGQTVSSGEDIARIVPENAPLKIKAEVSPENISSLEVGQNVQMRVSACPYTDYGTLKGVVSQISKDTINPQSNGNLGQQENPNSNFYQVTIEPNSLFLDSGRNQCAIKLGMEGRADIITKEETVLRFVLRNAKLFMDF